jgi:hypothetical protein
MLASIALVVTAINSFFQWRLSRQRLPTQIRLEDATAAKDISSAWKDFVTSSIEPLQKRLAEFEAANIDLRIRVTTLDHIVNILIDGVAQLSAQIRSVGLTPVFEYKSERPTSSVNGSAVQRSHSKGDKV